MSPISYDAAFRSMRDQGIPAHVAEREARKAAGIPAVDPNAERNARILEAEEQREITKLFAAFGFRVRSTSQYRAAKISPDFPDLWATRAARIVERRDGRFLSPALAFWWESKRQVGGERTPGQVEFGDECIAASVGYGFGDRYAAQQYLITIGVAEIVNGVLEPARDR